MKFKTKIKATSKLQFKSEEGFFGPGVCYLLECIDQHGSIQEACKEMNISYSKARKIIQRLEKQVDMPIVLRKAGGSHGGHAYLTQEGKELVHQFNQMNTELQQYTNQLLNQYFGGYFDETN